MRFQIIFLLLAVFLTACGANSQKDELLDRPDPEGPIIPVPPGPQPPVPPEPPGPTIPPVPPKPAPKVCVESHSGNQEGDAANSRADFVFYPDVANKLQSHKVQNDAITMTAVAGNSSATVPFQSISGNSLATQTGFNNGEWQFERALGVNSKKLIFKDTLSGEARQVSNFDFAGNQICSLTQIKPATDRLSEFYISYGNQCSLTQKVDLSMSATDAAIQIPNPAIFEGTAIYDGDANWLGQLYKVTDEGVAKLVLQKPDFCSQNVLLEFESLNDAWTAKQFIDGSLLLQVGAKIYNVSSADLLAWVADEPSFTLPAEALITLPNTDQSVWLDKNATDIFYTSLIITEDSDTKLDVIQNAELYVANISTGAQEAQVSLYSGADTDKTIVGFDKIILDDESVWLETSFTTKPATETLYHRRYSRLSLNTNTLDSIAEFDYPLELRSQTSEWHSIDNKVYLKVNAGTSIKHGIDVAGEKDYLLQPGVAKTNVNKIWHFIKQGSAIDKEADGVIAWDYSSHAGSLYVPELITASGSTPFPVVNRNIQISSMSAQFKELSLFWDIDCTSGCDAADPIAQIDYRVSVIKHDDNSSIATVYHETCDIVKATTDPVAPQSQTCTVNP